jgi:hypothetical protein
MRLQLPLSYSFDRMLPNDMPLRIDTFSNAKLLCVVPKHLTFHTSCKVALRNLDQSGRIMLGLWLSTMETLSSQIAGSDRQ